MATARSRDAPAARHSDTAEANAAMRADRLTERLPAAGFDAGRPALFLWLGVTCYLDPDAFHRTLAELRRLGAPGSRLVLDYVDPAVTRRTTRLPGARRVARMVERRGEPYRFGTTAPELATALAAHGFTLRETVDLPGLAGRYAAADGVWCSTAGWQHVATASRP